MDIILFSILALFLVYKLRETLGKSDEDALPPQQNKTIKKKGNVIEADFQDVSKKNEFDNKKEAVVLFGTDQDNIADKKRLLDQIQKIKKLDSSFIFSDFIDGAKTAFDLVLEDFALNKKDNIKFLLSDDLLKAFSKAIEKNSKLEKYESTDLVRIISADLKDIDIKNNIVSIKIAFVSEQINSYRDKKSMIIKEDSKNNSIFKSEDEWVFERNIKSSNPNWTITAT